MTQSQPFPDDQKTTEQLLRSREARGLIWSISARLAFIVVVILLTPMLAYTGPEVFVILTILFLGGALSVYSWVLARRQEHLTFVGLAGVSFDLLFLVSLPFIWHHAINVADVPLAVMLKQPLEIPSIVLIVINTMAIRPLYPAIIAAGSVAIKLAVAGLVLGDPRVLLTERRLQALLGPEASLSDYATSIIAIALVGAFLTLLARAARRTVHDVVELEAENRRIVKEQAQMIMEVKMAGLANLVAGVAHEVNTPLGVTMSSVNTVEACASKIEEEIQAAEGNEALKNNRQVNRALGVQKENTGIIKKAGQRIGSVVQSLKNFSRLDEAEVQRTDVRAGLDSTLALILPETRGNAQVVKEYEDVPQIYCRPKELNQVFMTLITNAFQAMAGEGTLRVHVASDNGQVTVEIADTGKGIPPEQLKSLFEIGFGTGKGRVGMGLGLPTGKNIIERHGGALSVESEVGRGTTFRISLPVQGVT